MCLFSNHHLPRKLAFYIHVHNNLAYFEKEKIDSSIDVKKTVFDPLKKMITEKRIFAY